MAKDPKSGEKKTKKAYSGVANDKVDLTKEVLKPITKVKSKEDKEFQELEVESTKGGMNAG